MGSLISDALSAPGSKRSGSLVQRFRLVLSLISALIILYVLHQSSTLTPYAGKPLRVEHSKEVYLRCLTRNVKPGPPASFHKRKESDRFVPGTKATFIKNTTIWTGFDEGREVFNGDLLLVGGLIRWMARDLSAKVKAAAIDADVIDAEGAWLTPGYAFDPSYDLKSQFHEAFITRIIDIHSHIGLGQAPALEGSEDGNSMKGTTGSGMPWLRALDGLNTHDDSYGLAVAGGVTTSLILPGSANAIGH